jgi:hypothetical protein
LCLRMAIWDNPAAFWLDRLDSHTAPRCTMPISRSKPAPAAKPPIVRVAIAIGTLGVLWTAVPRIDAWQRRRFADRMAAVAEDSAGGAARLAVRRLADTGAKSLDALVRLAGSANADAADAARDAVLNDLAAWEISFSVCGDERTFAKQIQELSAALAASAPRFEPAERAWAARVALQLVADCDRLPGALTFDVLAQCDQVLSAAAAVARAKSPAVVKVAVAAPPSISRQVPAPSKAAVFSGGSAPSLGGAADVHVVEQSPVVQAEPLRQSPTREGIGPTSDDWHAAAPPKEALDSLAARPLPAPAPSQAVVDVPTPLEARRVLRQFRQMPDRDLARRLISASGYELLAIQQVLRERKLPTATRPTPQRAVGGAVGVDPDRKLFERVGKLPAAQARTLLRELAADPTESPDVRFEALSLLATSGDPMLTEIARVRALEDADPRVADLATRILHETR